MLAVRGNNIFMETWTPTQADLENYQHIVLTSPHPWNPVEVKFPGLSIVDRKEIECRNIGTVNVEDGCR